MIPDSVEVFGSWAHPLDGLLWWKLGAYIISARCKARCHYLREVVSRQDIDNAYHVASLWVCYENLIRLAVERVHPGKA
jgi:hypothetical protein